jgi:hypothetical protein
MLVAGRSTGVRRRHAAGDFAGLVATHTVGQNRQAPISVGKYRILVLSAHQSGVGTHHHFQRAQETVRHVFSP